MFNLNKSSSITLVKKQFFSLLFVAFSFTVFAQKSIYENSDLFYKKVEDLVLRYEFDYALKIVDTLSQKNSFFGCGNKNYLKGFIYEMKFQKNKIPKDYDSSFFYFSKSLSCARGLNDDINSQLKNLGNISKNKTVDALSSIQIDSAEFYYAQSRKAFILIDSSNVYKNDIEFYFSCGSICMSIYDKEREANKVYFERGLAYYNKVLAIDSNNYKANYNIMIAYYNDGVTELRKADYCKQVDIAYSVDWSNPNQEIPSIEKLLECIKPEEFEKYNVMLTFKKALPFALKAHKIAPSNKHILEALTGIYYAMNDKKAFSKYRNELKKLN